MGERGVGKWKQPTMDTRAPTARSKNRVLANFLGGKSVSRNIYLLLECVIVSRVLLLLRPRPCPRPCGNGSVPE
jgi:hypothetical protein